MMTVYQYVCLSSSHDKYAARLQELYIQGSTNETWIEKSSDRNGIENMKGSRTIFQIENK